MNNIKNFLRSIRCKWSGHTFKHVQEYINDIPNGYHWECKRCDKIMKPVKN